MIWTWSGQKVSLELFDLVNNMCNTLFSINESDDHIEFYSVVQIQL